MSTVNLPSTSISTPVENSNSPISTQEVVQQKIHDLKFPLQAAKLTKTSLEDRKVSVPEQGSVEEFWASQAFWQKRTELLGGIGANKEAIGVALKFLEDNIEKIIKHVKTDTTTAPQLSPDLEDKLKILETHIDDIGKFYQWAFEKAQSKKPLESADLTEITSVIVESKQQQEILDKLDEIAQSLRENVEALGGDSAQKEQEAVRKGPRLPGLPRETTYTYLYAKIVEGNRPRLFWKIACSIFKVPTEPLKEGHYNYCHRHMDMLKKFIGHRTEILEDLSKNSERVLNQKAGFLVHLDQNSKDAAIKGFEEYPGLFIQEYEKAKKGGYLVEFFQEALGGACFPARSRTLISFAEKHNVELREARACTENSSIMDILNEEVGIYTSGKGKGVEDELEIYRGFIEQLKQLYGMKDEDTFNLKGMKDGVQGELTVQDIKDYLRDILAYDNIE